MIEQILTKMNGYKTILTTVLLTIALGLGGWNLLETVSHGKEITRVDVKLLDHIVTSSEQYERVEDKFEKIMNKLEEISCYIYEQKGIQKERERQEKMDLEEK